MLPQPQPHANRYRLYIDESGDHAYNLLDDPSHRYLALLGVWFRQHDHYTAFADDLERLKRDIFGPRPDDPVILHRSAIINRKGPFGLLCRPDVQAAFDDRLLEVVGRASCTVGGVVLDKKGIQVELQGLFHPYHYCVDKLLDICSAWLESNNGVGDVMAETRGRQEDSELKGEYLLGYRDVARATGAEKDVFRDDEQTVPFTSKDLKIRPKTANIAGLQLADLLAHPVKQAILADSGRIDHPGSHFGRRLYETAKTKIYHVILV